MITAADFMRFPPEDRTVALDTFREHLARLLLAQVVAVLIRDRHPSAAWIKVRLPNDYASRTADFVDLVSIRDAGGYICGGIGPGPAAEVTVLLCDVQRVWPGLLGRPDPGGPCVLRVDLPPAPAGD